MPSVAERRTHDSVRNGTTNLYAALDVVSGQVISTMTWRHRAEEFPSFLNLIDNSVPEHLAVHVVLDNSSTHKTPAIQRWLVRHPRFTLHFMPTHSSSSASVRFGDVYSVNGHRSEIARLQEPGCDAVDGSS
jgi:hypothetical protein